MSEFDRTQPIAGADLIVVSEHVDYWNNLGWVDQNSSQLFSERQNAYATRLHADGVYTPQLLVDGAYPIVGSDWRAAEHAIAVAAESQKIAISLSAKNLANQAEIHVSIDSPAKEGPADIYVVLAVDSVTRKVTAGENSGRQLAHTAVAFSFQKVGTLDNGPFTHEIHAPLGSKGKGRAVRVIVFAQDKKTGRVIGVTQAKI